ncbi:MULTISPECIES: acetylornithine transaminase [Microbacterium]|uniref:acetylornithine transaminase n=1 Tax=Microbacterium TaxID=33882 RepID=UPI000C66FB68|nr:MULTISPECIES: acetylornithine transaminase [Microbacterium]MAB20250.1 acetylornithine aminotransferase [Microbacterium sp.]MAY51536.1 acetylornithine aminotransferase [Microbacterium sp.]HAS33605.1 acetylornithine transaminase [Microbacterium sp.]HBS76174.1 acetylornithine transaminase [Microbacterium sp.]|tara:strand:+ start:108011 stop:109264 length:1254 start_codon:yes stop_codon:yes gene_type:complete
MTGTATWRDDAGRDLIRNAGDRFALFVRGEGAYVWDEHGTRYLDFLAGIAVNSLGHAHPVFVDAVATQAATLAHVSNYFATPPQLALAAKLKDLAGTGPSGRVYFANSGAEANEAAFKLARLHGAARDGRPARLRILTLENAFHGRTMGTLALTGKPAMQEPFLPMVAGVEHIAPTIEALEHAMGDDVAALVVEPIQGEAGVVDLPEGYLAAARELTARHGALLIVDEIQTGAGRTGEWFGYQHAGITPDAITVAKGIGGGFPIGALVTFGDSSELFYPGTHGSTFGGNALGTAVSLAVLCEIERADLVENAATRGTQLRERISAIGSPLVAGTRGRGLLIGVALKHPVAGAVVAAAQEHGLIVNAANPSTVRVAPPLNIGDVEIDDFIGLFARALATVETSVLLDADESATTEVPA